MNRERWRNLAAEIAADEAATTILDELRRRATHALTEPPVEFVLEGRRLLAPARILVDRALNLAMIFRLEGDERFLARLVPDLRAAARLPDWNPSHFLDTAEMTFALGTALDWLGDDLAEADRELIGEAIIANSLRPAMADSYGHPNGWVAGHNNWTQVCHAGLTVGALAVRDRDPVLADQIIERAIRFVPGAVPAYEPDGAYSEGVLYWNYATTYHVLLAEALIHAFGEDFGLTSSGGFRSSADYIRQMTTPTGRIFNYGDALPGAGGGVATGLDAAGRETLAKRLNVPFFWFARRMNRPDLVAEAFAAFRAGGDTSGVNGRFLAFALLWGVGLNADGGGSPPPPLARNWRGEGASDVSVHRAAWGDPAATFIGLKGGSPAVPHAHMDVGSFMLEAGGVRWAVDPGLQDYHSLESVGVELWDNSEGGARWGVFRLGPEAHNILRVDGAPQRVAGRSVTVSFEAEGDWPGTVLDLSDLYPGVERVTRAVHLDPDGGVSIRDKWTAGGRDVGVTSQWLTSARVEIHPDGLVLHEAGRTLHVEVSTPNGAGWQGKARDGSELLRPFDEATPGLQRIEVFTTTPASTPGGLFLHARLQH